MDQQLILQEKASNNSRQRLNGKIISRFGDVNWPSRFPSLIIADLQ